MILKLGGALHFTIQKTQLAKTISCAVERNNNVYWCYMKMCFKIVTIQKTQLAKTISCAVERNNNVYWCYMKMCFKIAM